MPRASSLASALLVLAPFIAPAQALQSLPTWWKGLAALPRLEARFVQTSESAVFGRLERKGRLHMARGGRLRVRYDTGLLLVADGQELIQYDPEARTAQRFDLRRAVQDMPLLNLLVDPGALPATYQLEAMGASGVRLKPRKPGLPEVLAEGSGQSLSRLRWKDGTGAEQELRLSDSKAPNAPASPSTFTFEAPKGTRWLK